MIPWYALKALTKPDTPRSAGRRPASRSFGHDAAYSPFAAAVCSQRLAMEEAQIEAPTMRRFASIDLLRDRALNKNTCPRLPALAREARGSEQIFGIIKAQPSSLGTTSRQRTNV